MFLFIRTLTLAERTCGRAAGPLLLGILLAGACSGVRLQDLESPRPAPPQACLIVGFLGGRDRWDDDTKGVRQAALRLRNPDRHIYAETFENRRREIALEFVVGALDENADGEIAPEEVARSTLVLYGQSLGGSATLEFARQLAELDVPVRLTVQIDSVGRGDAEVPANVLYAANLYQDSGTLIEGEHPVLAVDAARTRVIGNWRFDYDEPPGADISLDSLPWWKKIFRVAHAKMDRDPRVWEAAETLLAGACHGEDLEALAVRIAERIHES